MMKRWFDMGLSLTSLMLLLPFLLAVAAFTRLEDSGPVFYRGERVGRYGHRFQIYKFRTMVVNADKIGGSSTPVDDPRITWVGRWIRVYKLDELPQLINVLKGEMSFVGPRPQVPWAVELYNEKQKALLTVRPGITDYASIQFRNETEILRGSMNPDKDYLEKIAPEKIRLGLEYVQNHSLWLDLKIIFATLLCVIGRDPHRILKMPKVLGGSDETVLERG